MNKVLVSDYDKTFYLNDIDIIKNIESVKKFRKQGNLFIFATGRSYLDFNIVKDKYNLEYDYLILNHGSTILDCNDNVLLNIPIANNTFNTIKNDLKLDTSIRHFCCSKLDSRANFNNKDLTKINIKYDSSKTAYEVSKSINAKYNNLITSYIVSNTTIEIVSNNVNKNNAIEYIVKHLDIDKDNVFTIGDSYSDYEMIKNFNGYCMKDSKKEIKAIAKKEYNNVYELINNIE